MLPFIAGAIVGAIAVIAVKNRKTITEKISDTVSNVKENLMGAGSSVKEKIHDLTAEAEIVKKETAKKETVKKDTVKVEKVEKKVTKAKK